MEGKIWSKFHPLFGPDLKVGFETTFPAVTVLDLLDPRYEKNGLIHYQPKKPIVRVCEPATKIVGSCVDGEIATFGFDSWNSNDQRYLALAYPGESVDGQFTPVYFKIQNGKEGFVYLEVWALDDEVQALVRAGRIEGGAAGEHVRSAAPDEGGEAKIVYSV